MVTDLLSDQDMPTGSKTNGINASQTLISFNSKGQRGEVSLLKMPLKESTSPPNTQPPPAPPDKFVTHVGPCPWS